MEYGEEKKTYGVLLPVLLVVALLIGYFYLKPGPSDKASPETAANWCCTPRRCSLRT